MKVLFASSNGVGLGHIARQMAVADRLPQDCRSFFVTMSYAARFVVERGYPAFYLSHHAANRLDITEWNRLLDLELTAHLDAIQPDVFVYDASAVFSGVLNAMSRHPDMQRIWIRRAMWREVHGKFLQHSARFHTVIEPGELAAETDQGPTRALRSDVMVVDPVLHLGPEERLGRQEARQALDIPPDMTVLGLQLANDSYLQQQSVRNAALEWLERRPDLFIAEFCSPLLKQSAPSHARHRQFKLFPAYSYSAACDFSVSAAGYNSFHENILGCIPTIFIPNEAPEMDLQANRALWAQDAGLATMFRRSEDLQAFESLMQRMLTPEERDAIAQRCAGLRHENGAAQIARHIAACG